MNLFHGPFHNIPNTGFGFILYFYITFFNIKLASNYPHDLYHKMQHEDNYHCLLLLLPSIGTFYDVIRSYAPIIKMISFLQIIIWINFSSHWCLDSLLFNSKRLQSIIKRHSWRHSIGWYKSGKSGKSGPHTILIWSGGRNYLHWKML